MPVSISGRAAEAAAAGAPAVGALRRELWWRWAPLAPRPLGTKKKKKEKEKKKKKVYIYIYKHTHIYVYVFASKNINQKETD